MRFFHIHEQFTELPGWPSAMPAQGYLWVTTSRRVFEVHQAQVQLHLQRLTGGGLVDLHVSDLLNHQLPSQYDYTSWYDMMVFRRLAPGAGTADQFVDDVHGTASSARQAMAAIDTSPVGFTLFDRVLLTVHPAECTVRDFFEVRLGQMVPPAPSTLGVPGDLSEGIAALSDPKADEAPTVSAWAEPDPADTTRRHRPEYRGSNSRMPPSPADLMLRIVNHMVDGYLDLRRLLTRQFGHLQQELLNQRSPFTHWQALLDSRNTLHLLEDTCEDQRSAMQEWIDALEEWPLPADPVGVRERELLRVRSRDVQEHIERVLGHVRRLESSIESALQMHFSLQSSRTNDIMRTLTALTAVFLPLNLITGVFGMNFDALPLIHHGAGFWVACGMMACVVVGLVWWFRRQRYLGED